MKRTKMNSVVRVLACVTILGLAAPIAMGAPGEVLILGGTVTGGAGSLEGLAVVATGRTPVVVSDATWSGMSTSDFADYDAIVLGDPTCFFPAGPVSVAAANAATWAAAVTGNVSIWGTDPQWHSSAGFGGAQGGDEVTTAGVEFAVSGSSTGAYITTSCYFDGAAAGTPVSFLDGFGTFTAQGAQCWNTSHIVATSPALAALVDADVSDWFCSAHNFFNSFPADFIPLVIAEGVPGGTFTASDGTVGGVYVLARGVTALGEVPTVSEWGLVIMALLLLVGGRVYFNRRWTRSLS